MFKKIIKIALWIAIVFFVIFLIALLILRIKFPPQKIKQLAISELETAINRKAQVGTTWFNPVKGFMLNDVEIYQHSPTDSNIIDTTSFLRSKKIQLKYRFLSLLKREIEINNILIDQPEINLRQDQNQRWNFEDLIVVDTTDVPPPPDTGAVKFSLPASIKLKKFSLDNFITNLIIDKTDTVITIRSGGLSIHVDDLFLPRQPYDEFKKNALADLKLFSGEAPWEITLYTKSSAEKTELKANLQLDLKINLSGLNNVQSEGKLGVTNLQYESKDYANVGNKIFLPKLASLYYALSTDAEKGNLSVEELTGQIGEETLFNIQGKITDYLNQPIFDLAVVQSEIKLENFISLMLPFLPDSVQHQRKDISITGLASFKGTTMKGNPLTKNIIDALKVNLLFSVDRFFGSYVDPRLKLNNLNIKSEVTQVQNLNGVQQADILINASLDSFYMAVDTLEFGYGGLTLDFKTALDAESMPDSIITNFTVQNFYDVPLDLSLFFKAINGLNQFKANGSLVVKQLLLWNLPESPLAGLVDFVLNF